MKSVIAAIFLLFGLSAVGQKKMVSQQGQYSNRDTSQGIPSLDDLSGDWMEVSTLRNFPSVMNFNGGLQTTANLTAFQHLTLPPFAEGGIAAVVQVNGQPLNAAYSLWRPYEVVRKAKKEGVEFVSAIRMPLGRQGLLLRLQITNHSTKTQTFDLSMSAEGRIRKYAPDHWNQWGNERPEDTGFVGSLDKSGKAIIVKDSHSTAISTYFFAGQPTRILENGAKGVVQWHIRLPAGATRRIDLAVVTGDKQSEVLATGRKWVADFSSQFNGVKSDWENRWQAAFNPKDPFFSGHFPTLVTDDAKIRRVYYEGALIPLLMCRTNLPYSPRCYVTAGPQWANTLTYFWDAEMWANTFALLDPQIMKIQLQKWLTLDHHSCYAVDCLSGKPAGPWYAANDWSIFRSIEAYIGVTGDTAFLHEKAGGSSVLQHLDQMATFFESRPLTKNTMLANYGGPANLLECSPSYIQGVASLNAANVYMLRKVGSYQQLTGHIERAEELRQKAADLLPQVMDLYESGQGVWNAIDANGTKVPIRHCYDYITIGQALEKDLTPVIKRQMDHFVDTELRTKTWMRAMSLKDPASAKSDRPDHGPMGSYDAWPPMTMDVMCRFGDFKEALSFLRATESVTHQGSWAQSHEFLGPDSRGYNPIIRVAHRGGQDANEGCGAAFAEVIIRSFFGFRPDLSKEKPVLFMPETARGFIGALKHVSWHGQLYTIKSGTSGLQLIKERK